MRPVASTWLSLASGDHAQESYLDRGGMPHLSRAQLAIDRGTDLLTWN